VKYFSEMTLDDCRRFYADEIRYAGNIKSPAILKAFTQVPREDFLGPGPWHIACADLGLGSVQYIATADADPRNVYHNVAIALDSSRDLNNGQPGALAHWLEALDLQAGNRVFHMGCGVGYYTAIMASVVGPSGRVLANEVDPELAERAQCNLASYKNVEVHGGDGAVLDPGTCDAMLINAGVTHPHSLWLDRLHENGGRMVLPLTIAMAPNLGKGVMLRITRTPAGFLARILTFVAIYSCTSVRDPRLEPVLANALRSGALMKIKSVRRDEHQPEGSCVVHRQDACLSTAELPSPQ